MSKALDYLWQTLIAEGFTPNGATANLENFGVKIFSDAYVNQKTKRTKIFLQRTPALRGYLSRSNASPTIGFHILSTYGDHECAMVSQLLRGKLSFDERPVIPCVCSKLSTGKVLVCWLVSENGLTGKIITRKNFNPKISRFTVIAECKLGPEVEFRY